MSLVSSKTNVFGRGSASAPSTHRMALSSTPRFDLYDAFSVDGSNPCEKEQVSALAAALCRPGSHELHCGRGPKLYEDAMSPPPHEVFTF
ncbi:MAG: hypothetical protein M0Z95_24480, partial [Actinomycetota bacterium]|nr:hypothetical protein [Actinomycetota bacterium]